MIEMYKMKFEQEGYEVVPAPDGETGIEALKNQSFDLLLIDLVLPGVDGYAVLKAAKKNPKNKKAKMYILSNLGQSSEVKKAFEKGADGYFVKADLTPSELEKGVEDIFKGKAVGKRPEDLVKE